MTAPIGRPDLSEYDSFYSRYIDLVEGDAILWTLAAQIEKSLATLRSIRDEISLHRYSPDKWSLREVIGHLADTERILAYRALRFARNDCTELSPFDQDGYVAAARFDDHSWRDLLGELEVVRKANLYLFRGLAPEAWVRKGILNHSQTSVRALAYVIAGHELHHMQVIRTHYLSN